MSAPRLIELELMVSDVDGAVALYRDVLGVPLEGHTHADGEPVHHHASWGHWDAGPEGGFLLLSIYPAAARHVTRSSFGFSVEDLDAVHRRVEAAGVKVVRSPTTRPWGRTATYEDVDGNTISVTEA